MLVELHVIQNHSPSNLNRDDLGAPKTCMFGGTIRARISSQCIKRSIRNPGNPEDVHNRGAGLFAQAMGKHIGIRTRSFPELVRRALESSSIPRDEHDQIVRACTKMAEADDRAGQKTEEAQDTEERRLPQLVFLERTEAEAFVTRLSEMRHDEKWSPSYAKWLKGGLEKKALVSFLRELSRAYKRRSADIALFGRMTTSDAFEDVEAAMQVAHAVSTHEVTTEVDYFTAVDDLGESGGGAGYVDEAMFDSACFYKYFCLDWDQLLANLTGPADASAATVELAAATLGHLLRAAALANPSGKQNSFAAHNLPDGILVEVKREQKVPVSYANAFAQAVPLVSQRGLIGQSIVQLGQYVHDVAHGFGIPAERYWFSPAGRFPLTWVDCANDPSHAEHTLVEPSQMFTTLDDLVGRVVQQVSTLEWKSVRDAATTQPHRRP